MFQSKVDLCQSQTIPFMPNRRQRRGKTAYQTGVSAEQAVERIYVAKGAAILGRRVKTPFGEIDLVADASGTLIFIEVKARRHNIGCESPIKPAQWERLKNAANHYMLPVLSETGVHPACRFDAALMDRIGQVTIYENACSFDEQ